MGMLLTPETAPKQNETVADMVDGVYLAIAFFVASDSERKTFRET